MSKISLSSFCKQRNIPKTTAHTRLQERGFDTSKGLSIEAQMFLLQSFNLTEQPKVEVVEPKVETAETPSMKGSLDLAKFQDTSLRRTQIEDPVMAAALAIQALQHMSKQAQLATHKSQGELQELWEVNEALKKQAAQTQKDFQQAEMKQYVLDLLKEKGRSEVSQTLQEAQAHLSQG